MEEKPKFTAYCCGRPMEMRETETHIEFICATGVHGRWFVMAKSLKDRSYCSHIDFKTNKLTTELSTSDLGAVRLYSCPVCGARYSVFVDGIKFEAEVQGINADEVNKVGREIISHMWDIPHRFGGFQANSFKDEIDELKTKVKSHEKKRDDSAY